MKFIEVKTERRPDGVVTCTIWNEAGYITFVRNERGKLSTSARTTSFEPPVFSAAVKEAYRQIEGCEREARAAAALPGAQLKLV